MASVRPLAACWRAEVLLLEVSVAAPLAVVRSLEEAVLTVLREMTMLPRTSCVCVDATPRPAPTTSPSAVLIPEIRRHVVAITER